ncbi:MAG TPA: hypothetical protein VHI13_03680 [Candidatus Kapabacteria bacterium]|nr:hypothetical protein [Candidatus Kapabacteria bacterium]
MHLPSLGIGSLLVIPMLFAACEPADPIMPQTTKYWMIIAATQYSHVYRDSVADTVLCTISLTKPPATEFVDGGRVTFDGVEMHKQVADPRSQRIYYGDDTLRSMRESAIGFLLDGTAHHLHAEGRDSVPPLDAVIRLVPSLLRITQPLAEDTIDLNQPVFVEWTGAADPYDSVRLIIQPDTGRIYTSLSVPDIGTARLMPRDLFGAPGRGCICLYRDRSSPLLLADGREILLGTHQSSLMNVVIR